MVLSIDFGISSVLLINAIFELRTFSSQGIILISMKIKFSKLHGLGNNFIFIDNRERQFPLSEELPKRICDIQRGIGADGLILVERAEQADFKIRILNADGSEPEMCGNGVRCLAKYVLDEGLTTKVELSIETLSGLIQTKWMDQKGEGSVEVDMGRPVWRDEGLDKSVEIALAIPIDRFIFSYVSMGNPHAVCFVENYDFDYRRVGERIENDIARFPRRTNVEFVQTLGPNEINMRVWERGCGETQACGTGACAAVVAGISTDRLERKETVVHLLGGDLRIDWRDNDRVFMQGPAETICRGELYLRD